MDNPFLAHPRQLQQIWKDLRRSVADMPLMHDKLTTVCDFWQRAPLSKPYIDYLLPNTWPDPWCILDTRLLDESTVSIGIFYTLLLSGDPALSADNLRLCLVRNHHEHWERLVCIVQERYVLNQRMHEITDRASLLDMYILHSYTYNLHTKKMVETVASHQIS